MNLAVLDDFSDRVAPILVRELRVRLKRLPFLLTLLITHALLLFGLIQSLSFSYNFGAWLWPITILCLLVVALSASGGLRGEIKRGNFALLLLAGVTSRRLVRDKWFATSSLMLLAATTLIPWFAWWANVPGVNISLHFILLLMLLAALMTYVAIELWAHCQRSIFATVVVRMGLAIAVFVTIGILEDNSHFIATEEFITTLLILLPVILLCCTWVCWLALDTAATHLASDSDDFLFPQRLLTLVLPWLLFALSQLVLHPYSERFVHSGSSKPDWLDSLMEICPAVILVIGLSAAFAFLPQHAPRAARTYRRTLTGSWRWLSLPLAPGQAGSSLLMALAFAPLILLLLNPDSFDIIDRDSNDFLLVLLSNLPLASALTRILGKPDIGRHHGVLFILFLLVCTVLSILIAAITSAILSSTHYSGNEEKITKLILCLVPLALGLLAQIPAWRRDLLIYRRALHRHRSTQPATTVPTNADPAG